MGNKEAILATGLCKTFNGNEVISNCSMTVDKGTIYGFLGVNGAGKTTIFKLLTGLLKPTMGTAQIFGMDIVKQRIDILKCVGTLIEIPVFYDHLSAAENLQIHLGYMGKKEKENINEALSMVGLKNTRDQPVSQFSLGMRQRLAIARSFIHNPKLLILDEPINGLDPIGIGEMRDLFLDLVKNHNMTIIISSHILTEIEHIADNIGVIVNGTIVQEVSMSSLKTLYSNLEEYFKNIMNGRISNV